MIIIIMYYNYNYILVQKKSTIQNDTCVVEYIKSVYESPHRQ